MSGRERTHDYRITVRWTGNTGSGSSGYRDFERTHELSAEGKPTLTGSADPTFRGSAELWSPEDLLLAALSSCHLLSYLALCSINGVVVTAYRDTAEGTMTVGRDGSLTSGRFTEVVLRPEVTVSQPAMREQAFALHEQAHRACFIANSVNFPVRNEPRIQPTSANP